MRVSLEETEIIAHHFKKRLSGVTSTIIQFIPIATRTGCAYIHFWVWFTTNFAGSFL